MEALTVVFEIKCTTVYGENVFVVGSADWLGKWDPAKAVALGYTSDSIWKSPPLKVFHDFDYKYLIKSSSEAKWESRENRKFSVLSNTDNKYSRVTVTEAWNDIKYKCVPSDPRISKSQKDRKTAEDQREEAKKEELRRKAEEEKRNEQEAEKKRKKEDEQKN